VQDENGTDEQLSPSLRRSTREASKKAKEKLKLRGGGGDNAHDQSMAGAGGGLSDSVS
jgi:hypothetical protein